jgi:hypothetical protein
MLKHLLAQLETQPFAMAIKEGEWQFPTVETIHVIALTLVVGSIAMVDLRLLGIAHRKRSVTELAGEVLPWTWACFAVAVTAGFLLFSSNAVAYSQNLFFRIKMVLLLLAGFNMAVFHFGAYRTAHAWGDDAPTPLPARIAGLLSLGFWIGVVACGRWIGFTLTH